MYIWSWERENVNLNLKVRWRKLCVSKRNKTICLCCCQKSNLICYIWRQLFFLSLFAISDGHSLAVLRPHGLRLTNEQQTSQPTGDGHVKISGSSLFRDILTENVWLWNKAENSSKILRCERGWSSTLVSFILTLLFNGCQSWKLTCLWRIKVFVFIPYIPSAVRIYFI